MEKVENLNLHLLTGVLYDILTFGVNTMFSQMDRLDYTRAVICIRGAVFSENSLYAEMI